VDGYPCEQYILCKDGSGESCHFHIYSECGIPFSKALPYSNLLKYLPDGKKYTIKYYDMYQNKVVTVSVKGGAENIKTVPLNLVANCKVDKMPAPGIINNLGAIFGTVTEYAVSKPMDPGAIYVQPAENFLGEKPKYDFCYFGDISFSVQASEFLTEVGVFVGVAIADVLTEIATGGTASVAMGAVLAIERCVSGAFLVWATANIESGYYWPNNPDIDGKFISGSS